MVRSEVVEASNAPPSCFKATNDGCPVASNFSISIAASRARSLRVKSRDVLPSMGKDAASILIPCLIDRTDSMQKDAIFKRVNGENVLP